MAREAKHGTRTTYVRGCRCDPCKEANRQYGVDLKDRKRRGKPVLVPLRSPNIGPAPEPADPEINPDEPGRVEMAVNTEIQLLSQKVRDNHPGLIESALTMARDLDNPKLATTHPSSQRQLMVALDKLHDASVGRAGKLASVAQMSERGGKNGKAPASMASDA